MPEHLAFPIRVGANGRLLTNEQDGEQDVADSLALLVSTEPGERRSVPDYGLADPVFGGLSPEEVVDVAAEWEERADPASVEQVADDLVNQRVAIYPAVNEEVSE